MTPAAALRVAACWVPTSPADLDTSVAAHAAAVRDVDVDLAVFAEMSLTGYGMDAPAVEVDDPRLAPLVDACASTGTTALVGAPVRTGQGRSIAVLVVRGGTVEVGYRKMSLGNPEPEHYVAGDEPALVEVAGWRVGLGVCKDTRIEEHLHATKHLGVDAYAAGLVHSSGDEVELDRRARHIASTVGVPVVFSAAAAGRGIWSYDGTLLAQAFADPERTTAVTAVLEPRE